jgi:hypothetical protein
MRKIFTVAATAATFLIPGTEASSAADMAVKAHPELDRLHRV